MISHKNVLSILAAHRLSNMALNPNDVLLSYLPLPHVMERVVIVCAMFTGASIGFYRGDVINLLKEDIARLKPTVFVTVPRLFNKFYDGIKAKIADV